MGLRERVSLLARGTVRDAAGMPADSRRRIREPWNVHGQNKSCCRGFPGKTGNSGVNEQRIAAHVCFSKVEVRATAALANSSRVHFAHGRRERADSQPNPQVALFLLWRVQIRSPLLRQEAKAHICASL